MLVALHEAGQHLGGEDRGGKLGVLLQLLQEGAALQRLARAASAAVKIARACLRRLASDVALEARRLETALHEVAMAAEARGALRAARVPLDRLDDGGGMRLRVERVAHQARNTRLGVQRPEPLRKGYHRLKPLPHLLWCLLPSERGRRRRRPLQARVKGARQQLSQPPRQRTEMRLVLVFAEEHADHVRVLAS